MTIGAWITIDGERVADTADDVAAGNTTALAEIQLPWGRGTLVDQPEAATCQFALIDPPDGDTFTDVIHLGSTVELWASGDVSTGGSLETITDPSFETSEIRPRSVWFAYGGRPATAPRLHPSYAHSGNRSVIDDAGRLVIAPAPWDDVNPAAWDQIPTITPDNANDWDISVWLRGPIGGVVTVGIAALTTPRTPTTPPQGFYWNVTGSEDWQPITRSLAVTFSPGNWVGFQALLTNVNLMSWQEAPGTWETTGYAWSEYGTVWIDDLSISTSPTGLTRDALMFAGRITDMTVTLDAAGNRRIEAIAGDQLVDLSNRWIGQEPWPSETVTERVARILAAVDATAEVIIDPAFANRQVVSMDVDNQSAGDLLTDLAAGVDAVMWTAHHATTGAYLRFEDVETRTDRIPTTLRACDLLREPAKFTLDVTDAITRVDVVYWNQSVTPPTNRTVTFTDPAGIALYGNRRHGINSQFISLNAATWLGNRALNRNNVAEWRTDTLTRDLVAIPDRTGAERGNLLDLMDGTLRLGRRLNVIDVDGWITNRLLLTLEGGTYRYQPGGWTLELATTPVPDTITPLPQED